MGNERFTLSCHGPGAVVGARAMAAAGPGARAILVTGFEPFGRWPVNSSAEAVARLSGPGLATAILPVDHAAAAEAIVGLVAIHRPAVVLLTGLASAGRLRLETLGRPGPLALGAPRRARWDLPRSLGRLRAHGLPGKLSGNAGGYVCDTTFWAALGTGAPRVAFLHVPPLGGAWTARRIARAVSLVLAAEAGAPRFRGVGSASP